MKISSKVIKCISLGAFLLVLNVGQASALTTITGQVVGGYAAPISGSVIPTTVKSVPTLFKISFQVTEANANLQLCVGTQAQLNSKTCGTQLVDTGTLNAQGYLIKKT